MKFYGAILEHKETGHENTYASHPRD